MPFLANSGENRRSGNSMHKGMFVFHTLFHVHTLANRMHNALWWYGIISYKYSRINLKTITVCIVSSYFFCTCISSLSHYNWNYKQRILNFCRFACKKQQQQQNNCTFMHRLVLFSSLKSAGKIERNEREENKCHTINSNSKWQTQKLCDFTNDKLQFYLFIRSNKWLLNGMLFLWFTASVVAWRIKKNRITL